jgi:hypothetical protein
MTAALNRLRQLDIYVSSEKAATMVGKSVRWVQDNKERFKYRRKNQKRNLEYELTSVLQVWENLSHGKSEL